MSLREMECFGCGLTITCDDAMRTLRHRAPECEAFKEIVARNASAAFQENLAKNPVVLTPPTAEEAPEIARILACAREHGSENELLAAAEEFGHQGASLEDAALRLLREMRRHGWKVQF